MNISYIYRCNTANTAPRHNPGDFQHNWKRGPYLLLLLLIIDLTTLVSLGCIEYDSLSTHQTSNGKIINYENETNYFMFSNNQILISNFS